MITDDKFPWWCAFKSVVLKHFFRLLIAMGRERYSSNCSAAGLEAIWGDGGTVSHISSLMLVGGEWMVSFRFRSPFSSEEPRLLNEDEALGAPKIIWTFRRTEKSLFFLGIETRFLGRLSRTDWSIANKCKYQLNLSVLVFIAFLTNTDVFCVVMRYRLIINQRRFGEPFVSIFKVV